MRQEDSLAVRLDIWLTRVRGWQCYSTLAGMELAVDLGTGPGQSLTGFLLEGVTFSTSIPTWMQKWRSGAGD